MVSIVKILHRRWLTFPLFGKKGEIRKGRARISISLPVARRGGAGVRCWLIRNSPAGIPRTKSTYCHGWKRNGVEGVGRGGRKAEYTVENLLEVVTDNAPQRCKFRAAGVNLSALGDWSTSVPWRLLRNLNKRLARHLSAPLNKTFRTAAINPNETKSFKGFCSGFFANVVDRRDIVFWTMIKWMDFFRVLTMQAKCNSWAPVNEQLARWRREPTLGCSSSDACKWII